jgi:hypothetical protein
MNVLRTTKKIIDDCSYCNILNANGAKIAQVVNMGGRLLVDIFGNFMWTLF